MYSRRIRRNAGFERISEHPRRIVAGYDIRISLSDIQFELVNVQRVGNVELSDLSLNLGKCYNFEDLHDLLVHLSGVLEATWLAYSTVQLGKKVLVVGFKAEELKKYCLYLNFLVKVDNVEESLADIINYYLSEY